MLGICNRPVLLYVERTLLSSTTHTFYDIASRFYSCLKHNTPTSGGDVSAMQ